MKRILIGLLVLIAMIWTAIHFKAREPASRSSSFVGYSDTTWQVNDTAFWVHGSDTLRLDMSKFR